MLLSLDWDAFSGCRELIFDAPIWGTPDREADRLAAWQLRALKRDPAARSWAVLEDDFPLYPGYQVFEQYAGRPVYVAWSHAHAWAWLERFPGREVLNIDSHHDLYSLSGDTELVRPGNWAGLGLRCGLIERYAVSYPAWHADVRVAEGFDLSRTQAEISAHLDADLLARVSLTRHAPLPAPAEVEALLLAQSPAWSSPAHDAALVALAQTLNARRLSQPYLRPWPGSAP